MKGKLEKIFLFVLENGGTSSGAARHGWRPLEFEFDKFSPAVGQDEAVPSNDLGGDLS